MYKYKVKNIVLIIMSNSKKYNQYSITMTKYIKVSSYYDNIFYLHTCSY